MSKKKWADRQMSDVAYVDQAASWSKALTRMRARGPGDLENAMRSIERDYGVDYWILWRLRYRRQQIQDIGVSIYMRLLNAYQNECQRQARRLEHEGQIAQQIAQSSCSLVAAAEPVADHESEEKGLQPNVPELAEGQPVSAREIDSALLNGGAQ